MATPNRRFFCFGYALLTLLLCLDPSRLQRFAYLIYGASLLLLLSTLLLGKIAGGSQRWLDFGLFRLQSSEPAKLFLLLALARYFSERSEKQPLGFKDLLIPALLTGAPFCLILLQPDLGTALMLVICLFVMLAVHRISP